MVGSAAIVSSAALADISVYPNRLGCVSLRQVKMNHPSFGKGGTAYLPCNTLERTPIKMREDRMLFGEDS